MRTIFECFAVEDCGIEKSRDMGASWMMLLAVDHAFIFGHDLSFLCVSRKKDYVDSAGSYTSLLTKIDLNHQMQPEWIRPPVSRADMRIHNRANGCSITGEATTGEAGRGARLTLIMLDEFAFVGSPSDAEILSATADATRCRLFNSTPNGASNAFYDLITADSTRKIRLHWTEHPDKAKGLYRGESEKDLVVYDTATTEWDDRGTKRAFPDDYPLIFDGKMRSIWYDSECRRRAANPREIAQELDIDYQGSNYAYFPGDMLDRLIQHADTPIRTGTLDHDTDTAEPTGWSDGDGWARLWIELGPKGRPEPAKYGVAADIGMGTGATPSTIVVGNLETRQKVAEFQYGYMRPDQWATLFVAVARFFADKDGEPAQAIWESNGPGRAFGNRVMEIGLPHVYWRKEEMKLGSKPTDYPGWHNNADSATVLFNRYRQALAENTYRNPSKDALQDAKLYIVVVGGSSAPAHSGSQRKDDPTSARENHGDLVVADALLCKLMEEATPSEDAGLEEFAYGTVGWRRQTRRQEVAAFELEDDPGWDP
jgi:hypothetical protein